MTKKTLLLLLLLSQGTMSADYRASVREKQPKPSVLHKINWLRIVLDEGHIVRNPSSKQTTAAVKLNALRRWILTGTPIQNRMSDLWSMINFLRIEPFTNKRCVNLTQIILWNKYGIQYCHDTNFLIFSHSASL